MVSYQGGKGKGTGAGRASTQIAEAIVRRHGRELLYVEPFVGGGSVAEAMAPHCAAMHLGDLLADVVLMLQAAVSGWQAPAAPTHERYRELRHAEPSAERGFYGTAVSFGGKWFAGFSGDAAGHKAGGGRGKDPMGAGRRALDRFSTALRRVPYVQWAPGHDYRLSPTPPGAVVYCDPPYAGTSAYPGAPVAFDSGVFWDWAMRISRAGAAVYVSEYAAPSGWFPVWTARKRQTLSRAGNDEIRIEHLFAYIGE